jgi:hypothetical protein
MVGFITEQHLAQAEEEFPGISDYFEACTCKPRTFLELVARFECWCQEPRSARTGDAIKAA